MVTYATDNPFPSVLFEETEAVDLANNPASGQRRLIVDPSDHLLYLVDTAGTATVVGGGLTDPMTSRGDVIVRNASNVTARLAKGSAGTYLGSDGTDVAYAAVTDAQLSTSDITTNNASTSKHGFLKKLSNSATDYMDGTGAWSVPAGSSGGSTVWLQRQTFAASATLDVTSFVSGTYNTYLFILSDIVMSTTNVLAMRCSVAGTFDTGSNYVTSQHVWSSAGQTTGGGTTTSFTVYPVTSRTAATTAAKGITGHFRLYALGSTSLHKNFDGQMTGIDSASSIIQRLDLTMMYLSTSAVDGIRFLTNTGTVTSGTVDVYGEKHA